ncbi:response regulator [Nakamurella sp. GG22]
MIRVLIVDDHHLVRHWVAGMLRAAGGIDVVGECADGSEVSALAGAVLPDVVIMDSRMPVMSGTEATRALMAGGSASRVLMLTGSTSSTLARDAAEAGASGYLVKDGNSDVLIDAVRTVAAGGTVWPATSS